MYPGTSQQTIISASVWTTGVQTVSGNSNLVAGNIKKGVTIFGVSGTIDSFIGGDYWIIKNGDAVATGSSFKIARRHIAYNGDYTAELSDSYSNYFVDPPKSGSTRVFTSAYYTASGGTSEAGNTLIFKMPVPANSYMVLHMDIAYMKRMWGVNTDDASHGVALVPFSPTNDYCGTYTAGSKNGQKYWLNHCTFGTHYGGGRSWFCIAAYTSAYDVTTAMSLQGGKSAMSGVDHMNPPAYSSWWTYLGFKGYDRYKPSASTDDERLQIAIQNLWVTFTSS